MKITIFGSYLCGDILYALMKLREEGADGEDRAAAADPAHRKKFPPIEDNNPLYEGRKEREGPGIPLFIPENRTQTKDPDRVFAFKRI